MFSDKSYINCDDPVIHIIYPSLMANLVEERGVTKRQLFFNAKLDVGLLDNSKSRISLREFIQLVLTALDLTGDPTLGLHYGSRLNIASSGYLSTALMSCATLGDALVLCMKYYPANGVSMDIAFERHGNFVHAICPLLKQLPSSAQRFMLEAWLTAWRIHSCSLLQRELTFTELQLVYPEPSYVDLYRDFFACEIKFEAKTNTAIYLLEYLKEPLPTANDLILKICEQQCDELLAEIKALESLAGRVADLLLNWDGNHPSVENIAQALKLSPRALAKRLSDQGTSYQSIFNDVRRQRALQYIRSGDLSIETIAEKLGFSDASNFRKAFKRWTGLPPSYFRSRETAV